MKSYQTPHITSLICLVSGIMHAQAKPLLHPLFADHAVLQRHIKVPVWGWAQPGGKVHLSFAGQTKEAVADRDGKWTATLDPMPAASDGR